MRALRPAVRVAGVTSRGSDLQTRRQNVWTTYLLLGVIMASVYSWVPRPYQDALFDLTGLSSVVAIVLGVLLWTPRYRLPWYLLGGGLFLVTAGDMIWAFYENVLHEDSPFPSIADAFYLLGTVLIVAALSMVIHSRASGADRGRMIDAAIVGTGAGLLSWVFLMDPYARDPELSLLEKLISIAYPLMDSVMLAFVVGMLMAPDVRVRAFHFLVAGVVLFLLGDTVYAWLILADRYASGHPIDLTWMLAYVLFGVVALHPSMTRLSSPVRVDLYRLTLRRLLLLTTASLLAPAAMVIQVARGDRITVPLIAGGSAALFLLVVGRLYGMLAAHQRAVYREQTLRRVAGELVGVSDREEIFQAARSALHAIAAGQVRVYVARSQDAAGSAFEEASAQEPAAPPISLAQLPGSVQGALSAGRPTYVPDDDVAGFRERLAFPGDVTAIHCSPLIMDAELRGFLVVGASTLPDEITDALTSLGSQIALALESVTRAEQLRERQAESRLSSLVQNASDIIAIVDAGGIVRYASPSVERVLGMTPDELVGSELRALVHGDDAERLARFSRDLIARPAATHSLSIRMRHQDGAWRYIEAIGNNRLDDPLVNGIVINARDVSERKRAEDLLARQAFHDTLTGLPNRLLFMDRLGQALRRGARREGLAAVLFIDLDRFKWVNDSLGHEHGDNLLKSVASRIDSCLRSEDTVARLGGDEFTVLLEDVRTIDEATTVAGRILQEFKHPFTVAGQEIPVSASIGVALARTGVDGPATVLRQADVAMYHAKVSGKAGFAVFDEEMGRDALARLDLEAALRRALDLEELCIVFQPQVELSTGRIVGFEALVRWLKPGAGVVSPSAFIPLAEETGLIVEIGRFVLTQACRHARNWQDQYGADAPEVAVNLSARQFRDPALADDVAAVLQETGLAPHRLMLEITESTLMDAGDATLTTMRRLKALGTLLAIDDFGVGYSSLSYLEHFPVDMLKVDRSFVARLGQSERDKAIIEAINALGHIFGMRVVAEGVETAEQVGHLVTIGCDLGQGYLFATPLAPAAADAMLRRDR